MGCHFLLQGIFPDPGIEPRSPTLQANALTSEPPGKSNVKKAPPKDAHALIRGTYKYITSNGKSDFADATEIEKESESEVAQSCLTLCDPMDCSLPGFSIHVIFQARVLECVAIAFSRGSSPPRGQDQVSLIVGRCYLSNDTQT